MFILAGSKLATGDVGGAQGSPVANFFVANNSTDRGGVRVAFRDGKLITGSGDGDDEVINVDLAGTPPTIDSIVFPVSIYDAEARSQSFGQVRNAYIRVLNQANGQEIARYDLSEDASTETAMVFGELYRNGADWKFRAIGQGYASGLRGIAQDFGVNV